jgi:hypothetical protein
MTNHWWTDDEQLVAQLMEALRSAREVPPELLSAGTHDETARLCALTFATAGMTVELEVATDVLYGRIAPPQAGAVTAHVAGGAVTSADIDETGCFVIHPVPREPFRVRCVTQTGADVLTGWVNT